MPRNVDFEQQKVKLANAEVLSKTSIDVEKACRYGETNVPGKLRMAG